MLNVKLKVIGGDAKATEIQLKLPTTIGRARESTLTLPHPLVSRHHCELFEKQGRLFVRDLGSLNGTFVDNQRLASEAPLDPHHLLTIGNVTFRAIYELAQPVEGVVTGRPEAQETDQSFGGQQTDPANSDIHESTTEGPVHGQAAQIGLHATATPDPAPSSPPAPVDDRADERGVVADDGETVYNPGDQSVLEALGKVGASDGPPSVSQSSLQALQDQIGEKANKGFEVKVDIHDEDETSRPQVGSSFLDAIENSDKKADTKREVSQSSLDSFIRKLPK